MTLRRLAALALVPLVLALAACTPEPGPKPTRSDPGIGTCDPALFTENVDADLTVQAQPLENPGFPISDITKTGDPVTCTAHYVVSYAEGQTVEFDVGLVNTPIADLAGQLDDITGEKGWLRDEDDTIWRDPDDQNTFVQALEIDEGVLVGITTGG
jgi:hypothetical protein